jgi:hypothetical protein
MKINTILAILLILVMMVSVFGWLSETTPSQPVIVQPIVNDPTASPSSTAQQTTTPSATANPARVQNIGSWASSAWASILTPVVGKAPGLIESNENLTGAVWRTIAANAWSYFQPDNGVDRNTGLPKASLGFPYFTDWDLGVYIQAIIDANRTGLISNNGDWGSYARINKVLTFLETRELNSTTNYPFWFYQASDGKDYHTSSDLATGIVDAVDTARLFVALNNLKSFNSSLTGRINSIVVGPGNRSNYAVLVPDVLNDCKTSVSVYTYYCASGFASFWPNELANAPNMVLNNIGKTPKTTNGTYGVPLPEASISCEPLLCSVFELNNNSQLNSLANQVYLAHEANYNATGQYVAFSEGETMTGFIYEWVILPNGDTWKVMNSGEKSYSNINPIIYTKVSLSFLALYNTSFARNMAIYLEQNLPESTSGYYSGADYNTLGTANLVLSINCNTNGMILGAARYAIQSSPS